MLTFLLQKKWLRRLNPAKPKVLKKKKAKPIGPKTFSFLLGEFSILHWAKRPPPGVLKAVANINEIIAPKLMGMKVTEQAGHENESYIYLGISGIPKILF